MRRIPIYVSDDILMEEITAMATAAGFFLRHVDGMTTMDRVPGIIAKELPGNVSAIPAKRKKA